MATGGSAPLTETEVDALLVPLGAFASLVLAVSGGADSTALMHLVHGWSSRQGRDAKGIVAVTIDHGLRLGSAGEAAEVGRQAEALGIAHRTLAWTGDKPASGLQAAARAVRYRSLSKVACEIDNTSGGPVAIVTAHTADDQAETVIMRLARGSGVDGMAAIRAEGVAAAPVELGGCRHYPVVRPLLGIRRGRLVATLAAAGIPFADDPSNRDPRFERVRVREVLAGLEELGVTTESLSRTARRMQAAQAVLEWAADGLEALAVTSVLGIVHQVDWGLLADAPAETAARVLRRVLDFAGGEAPAADLGAVEDAVRRIVSSSDGRLAFTLGGCILETVPGTPMQPGRVRIYREPDRSGGLSRSIVRPGERVLWDGRFWATVDASHPRAVEVGALGAEWASLATTHPSLTSLSIPAAAARGIPAFRSGGRVIAVPLLAEYARGIGDTWTASEMAGPVCAGAAGPPGVEEAGLRIEPVGCRRGQPRRITLPD